MKVVAPNLAFGDASACTHDSSGTVAVVHACKEPCHRQAVGYTGRSLDRSHQHYLVLERPFHLYLNIIDPQAPLFMLPTFVAFLAFVDNHIKDRTVIIHCNQGESRTPSLALLYMAKRLRLLPSDSYANADAAFRLQFPYAPGHGIAKWLGQNWELIQ